MGINFQNVYRTEPNVVIHFTFHVSPNNPKGTVFYLKRGTTGISGQLVGICDSYFIALATGKSLQCTLIFFVHMQSPVGL